MSKCTLSVRGRSSDSTVSEMDWQVRRTREQGRTLSRGCARSGRGVRLLVRLHRRLHDRGMRDVRSAKVLRRVMLVPWRHAAVTVDSQNTAYASYGTTRFVRSLF